MVMLISSRYSLLVFNELLKAGRVCHKLADAFAELFGHHCILVHFQAEIGPVKLKSCHRRLSRAIVVQHTLNLCFAIG